MKKMWVRLLIPMLIKKFTMRSWQANFERYLINLSQGAFSLDGLDFKASWKSF